jgi:hypothetical protein
MTAEDVSTRRRTATHLLLVGLATAIVFESVVTLGQGNRAAGWSHWWCSPAALNSAAHTVGVSRGLLATLLAAFEVHWPHFLPILLGLVTLVYLWRANAQYHSQDGHGGSQTALRGSQ